MVVAHRGASSTVAEHTLAAYVSAIEAGARGPRVRRPADPRRPPGLRARPHRQPHVRRHAAWSATSTCAGLEALDFTSWRTDLPRPADELLGDSPYLAGVAPDLGEDGRVLTLERLLRAGRRRGRPVRLLIETKHPTRYGGLVEKELVDLLARFGWAGRPGPPDSLRAARRHGQPRGRHELRADRAAPGQAARAGHPDRAAAGAAPARPARRPAAGRRADRRARAAPAAGRSGASSSGPTPAATGCSCGRSTSPTRSTSCADSASTRSSPTGRRGARAARSDQPDLVATGIPVTADTNRLRLWSSGEHL